ncbi:hypothetical protein BC628DRAFT_57711 [Trametes gibbosa]|nr:hypothetical protein BC628DRAFT_57711 [Trametes gibbosa]
MGDLYRATLRSSGDARSSQIQNVQIVCESCWAWAWACTTDLQCMWISSRSSCTNRTASGLGASVSRPARWMLRKRGILSKSAVALVPPFLGAATQMQVWSVPPEIRYVPIAIRPRDRLRSKTTIIFASYALFDHESRARSRCALLVQAWTVGRSLVATTSQRSIHWNSSDVT